MGSNVGASDMDCDKVLQVVHIVIGMKSVFITTLLVIANMNISEHKKIGVWRTVGAANIQIEEI